jgi:calcyclin binding protein
MVNIEELNEDLKELRQFESSAKRPNVCLLLSNEIKKIEERVRQLSVKEKEPVQQAPISSTHTSGILPLIKLTTYAYDQSEKFLKLYVTVPGVEKIPSDRVTCKYTAKSLNLFVHDVQGKDYELVVQGLLFAIDPETSLFKIKKDTVLLMLKKQKESQNWSSVTEQEQKTKDKKALDKPSPKAGGEDPNASLMSLMKQMYDEGDDEMKRTIKKAWCESQDKKAGGGGGPGGMPDMGSMMEGF